jgi:hypothetical protein
MIDKKTAATYAADTASLLTDLSAAVHANDLTLAKQLLSEAVYCSRNQDVSNSIMQGKRIAKPEPVAPLTTGSNLDDCVKRFGLHNGYGKHGG